MIEGWILNILGLFSAVLYGAVGVAIWKRRPATAGRPAATSFAAWWIALGGISALGVVATLIGRFTPWTLAAYMAYLQVILLVIVVALAALMFYLVYIYTGKRTAWVPVMIGYAAYYLVLIYYIAWGDPISVETTATGAPDPVYERDLSGHWFTTAISALLILPIVAAAIAYFSLIRKVEGRSQKFRIAAVGGALALWFTSSFVAGTVLDIADTSWWPYVANGISLAAAYVILVAYAPPKWLRQRFDLHGFGGH